MAKGAGDADGGEAAGAVRGGFHSHDRAHLEELDRGRRIVQVDGSSLDSRDQRTWQHVGVDLEPDRERDPRTDSRARAATRAAFDGLVDLQRVAPERLVSERLEPERLSSLVDDEVGGAFRRIRRWRAAAALATDQRETCCVRNRKSSYMRLLTIDHGVSRG